MSNKVYDVLKYIAQIALPAIGALYFALSQIWPQLPYGQEIVGTITALDCFLGALLGISTAIYNKGVEKHNNLVERMYIAEGEIKVLEEKQRDFEGDLSDLKRANA